MDHGTFKDIEKLETDLWAAADQLRANSKLTSSDYFMPVLGVIFLRHAANRFDAAARQIQEDQASGKMPKRKVLPADYIRRRALWLPESARYDFIMEKATSDPAGLPKLVTDAMTAIEAEFEPLIGVLPKDYGIFEPKVLEDLMRLFNSEQIKQATGDVFGRIYEYFLAKFSIQKAHDNGEFFTPSSLVQTIVNVIEPDHGTVFDPANPPFNVDLVDAERIKTDPRLPFGLPGVNKDKRVSNANYLWISYFWSYLSKKGRAGFVMSSQASSAGHGEKEVRRKIVETGDVDVMISIRGNFFYTRTVPCELWHFDRNKPKERRDLVLMIDARGIYRKVTRTINDFSPEQLQNLSAIVWLYRGREDRFLGLVKDYLSAVCRECGRIRTVLSGFDADFSGVDEVFANVRDEVEQAQGSSVTGADFLSAADELTEAFSTYSSDRSELETAIAKFQKKSADAMPDTNAKQHAMRQAFDPIAERIKGLIKQLDLAYKLAARTADGAQKFLTERKENESDDELEHFVFDRRRLSKLVKELEAARKAAVDQLKHAAYFHRQVVWLQDRFPDAKLQAVPGLVKAVTRAEIEVADWSLTPGRYVGVAPAEVDDDFDFEQSIRDIHIELADLNHEAAELAATIQQNFEELGI